MEIQKSKYITPKTNFSETHLRKFYPHPKKNRTIFRKFPKLNETLSFLCEDSVINSK